MRQRALVAAAIGIIAGAVAIAQVPPQTKPLPPPGSRDVAPTAAAPAGTGAIAGTLIAFDTGKPVRRAQISINGGDVRISKSATTDERGNFSFTALPAGDFTLTATKGGFLSATYGQQKPGTGQAGTPIHLNAAQRVEKLSFQIQRGGVITGVITDEFGDAAFGTPVRAMRYSWRTGERTLQVAGSGTADDRGVYRIPALPPGDYVVSAIPREGQDAMGERMMRVEEMAMVASRSGSAAMMEEAKMMMAGMGAPGDAPDPTSGYAPVYFPGTVQASSASTFTLGAGEERAAVDLQLQLVPLVTVTGNVFSTQQAGPASIQLIDRSQPNGVNARSARTAPDGTFTIRGVTPGAYTLIARATARDGAPPTPFNVDGSREVMIEMKLEAKLGAGGAGATQLWGLFDVVVDGRSRPNVSVPLQPGMTVSGSVKFEGGTPPSPQQLARVLLTLAPVGAVGEVSMPSGVNLDAEGRFTIRGVFPGMYRVVPSSGVPPAYSIKSAVFNGRDSLDFPVEVKPSEDQSGGVVTFAASAAAEVSGSLLDTAGAAAPGYTIVIFAADQRFWTPNSRRIQTTRPSTEGRFGFRNLPAGDYRIVAVTDIEQGQWYDQALLRQLVGASTPITLSEGDRKTQDLRIR
jgi:hypothetical protein